MDKSGGNKSSGVEHFALCSVSSSPELPLVGVLVGGVCSFRVSFSICSCSWFALALETTNHVLWSRPHLLFRQRVSYEQLLVVKVMFGGRGCGNEELGAVLDRGQCGACSSC